MKCLTGRLCFVASLLVVFIIPAFADSPRDEGFSPKMKAKIERMKDVVPRITARELKAKMDSGEAIVVIDARTGNEYEGSKIKIKGAIRISIVKLEDRINELPRDKEIITYCT